jgi:hypothetical protein
VASHFVGDAKPNWTRRARALFNTLATAGCEEADVVDIEVGRLTEATVPGINCCPDGIEVKGAKLQGDLSRTLTWRQDMLKRGMEGLVAYHEGQARGFIEYMPAAVAPLPIDAPGGAVLMCYHWQPLEEDDEREHHAEEKRLIQRVIDKVKSGFSGLATFGWDNPVHFPISLLQELGFREVQMSGEIRLMWMPFRDDVSPARILPDQFKPHVLSAQGLLAIDAAWSSRCPYSIHNAARLDAVVNGLPEEVKPRVSSRSFCLDTREDVAAYCFSPWNWEWAYLNGEELPIFDMSSEQIRERILAEMDKLPGATVDARP